MSVMRMFVRSLSASLLLLAAVTAAPAQAPPAVSPPPNDLPQPGRTGAFPLTTAQRTAVRDAIRHDNTGRQAKTPPNLPSGQTVTVGTQLPPSVALDFLPDSALEQVPVTKTVQYTLINNQIVLVDPTNMRVVDIINP